MNIRYYLIGINYLIGIYRYIYIRYSYICRYVNFALVRGFVTNFLIERFYLCVVIPLMISLIKSGEIPYLGSPYIDFFHRPDTISEFTNPDFIEELNKSNYIEVNKKSKLVEDLMKSDVIEDLKKSDVIEVRDELIEGKADVSDGKKKGGRPDLVDCLVIFTCGIYIIGYLAYCSQ